jgi:muramoyltetrapeptide carboxypeptidase LdcA involved in peptidoglycan recycling
LINLIKPKKLSKGDTIATISISGGRAGDSDLLWRYKLGKTRLEEIFKLKVIETPNSMKGSDYLYKNPKNSA